MKVNGYVDSFTYWDTDFLKRADLVQHYYNLLHVRESFAFIAPAAFAAISVVSAKKEIAYIHFMRYSTG